MEDDKTPLNGKSAEQVSKEEKVLKLLDKLDQITLSDDFNRDILARLKEEKQPSSHYWYKPFAVLAASIAAFIIIWSFQRSATDDNLAKAPQADILVVENLDLLDNMEMLDHLDILIDTASTQVFLDLLGKG